MDTTAAPASEAPPPCPHRHATHVVRNGVIPSGSRRHLCRGCGRRFIAAPKKGPVSGDRKELIRRLLLERLSLRAIARVTAASRNWLQKLDNSLYRVAMPRERWPLEKCRAY